MAKNHVFEVRGMRVSSFPEPIFQELGWERSFFGRSGTNFQTYEVKLGELTKMGEMLGCLGNGNRVLAGLRREDVHSFLDRLVAHYH
jgi:hypothetical protein